MSRLGGPKNLPNLAEDATHLLLMNPVELIWHHPRGEELQAYDWPPQEGCNQAVILVHGHGEHAGRYDHLAAYLNVRGTALVGCDHIGHGRSGGQRGHIMDYEDYFASIDLAMQYVVERYGDVPVLLWGHSMGGNITLAYLLRRRSDFKGAVITGPYLRLAFTPPAWKVKLGGWMTDIYPKWADSTGLDASALSRDASVVKAYKADPLVHAKTSARAFHVLHHGGEAAIAKADSIDLPLLVMHGTGDQITDSRASEEFANAGGENVVYVPWEGLYHEIHNEPEQGEVFAAAWDWISGLG